MLRMLAIIFYFLLFFSSALCLLPEGKAELLMQNSGVKETLDDARSSVRQTLQFIKQVDQVEYKCL